MEQHEPVLLDSRKAYPLLDVVCDRRGSEYLSAAITWGRGRKSGL